MNKFKFLPFLLLFLSLVTACERDSVDLPETNFLSTDALFDCGNFELFPNEAKFQVNHIYAFKDYILYGGFEDLAVARTDNTAFILEDKYGVNGFLEYEDRLLICADEGIFSVDDELNINQETNVSCKELIVSSDDEVLFLTKGLTDTNLLPNKVYQLQDQEVLEYTNSATAGICVDLSNLVIAPNGDIWASKCSGLVRFRNKEFLDFFDTNNSPIQEFIMANQDQVFLLPYNQEMIFVAKNGIQYQILKYVDEEWIALYDFSVQRTPMSDQEVAVNGPSIVAAKIRGDFLYLATTIAGCRGFQVFDVSSEEELMPEDYFIVQDANFTNQCIDAFEVLPNGRIFVVTKEEIGVFDCEG